MLVGDILVSRLPDPVGRSCIMPDIGSKMITAVDCTIIRTNDELLSEYLKYYQLSNSYLKDVGSRTTGTTRNRISRKNLGLIEIPIPLLDEQKRIVAKLDECFAAIDKAKANVEQNLQNAKELFQSQLNQIFSQKSDGWVERKLGDEKLLKIIDGDRGKNYPKKTDFLNEGYCVFMNTGNVRPDGFNFNEVVFITKERDNLLRKGKLERNDVILTTRGTIGNIGLFNSTVQFEHIRINSGMLIFRTNKSEILPEYLFEVFRSSIMKEQIKEKTTGAAQPQLPIKTLVNFTIPVPVNLETQKGCVKQIHEINIQTQFLESNYQQELDALDELKKSILQKAFRGEL